MSKKKKKDTLPQSFYQLFASLSEGESKRFISQMTWTTLTEAEKNHFQSIVEFKKRAFDRAAQLGPEVWKNWDFVKDVFKYSLTEPSHGGVLAALSHPPGNQRAIGRTVITRLSRYSLLISHRAMTLSDDNLDKVLKHELLHIGYADHDRKFMDVCREVGGAVGGEAVTGGIVGTRFEQRQSNGRYKLASPIFETRREADSWFNSDAERERRKQQAIQWLGANPGKGMREVTKALMWRVVSS